MSPERIATRVLEATADAYVVTTEEGRIVHWNAAAERMFGWRLDEVAGKLLYEVALPEEQHAVAAERRPVELAKRDEDAIGEYAEFDVIARDGQRFQVEMSVCHLRDDQGVLTYHSFLREIPERRALAPYRGLDVVVEHSPTAIGIASASGTGTYGRVTMWNRAAERLFGWPAADILGSPISLIVPPELRDESQQIARDSHATGQPITLETERLRRDGTRIDVEMTYTPLEIPRLRSAAVAYRDISEEKQRERSLADLATYLKSIDEPPPAAVETGRSIATDVDPSPNLARHRQLNGSRAAIHSLDALLAALDARDHYTGEHSEAVVDLSREVAARLGLDTEMIETVAQTALLHDIGKVGIPDAVLLKPGSLTALERELMNQHPSIGARIVAGLGPVAHLAPSVRAEHERWDGRGYPDGLAGDAIPIAARITLACDAYHAMISHRPYRRAISHEDAVRELSENAGSQFDPDVIGALLEFLAE